MFHLHLSKDLQKILSSSPSTLNKMKHYLTLITSNSTNSHLPQLLQKQQAAAETLRIMKKVMIHSIYHLK